MKMKVKLNLLCGTFLLAAGTYLSGCTDKGTTPGVPQVSKGEPIQFSVGTVADAQSRTVYVDDYQLEWNIGDKIKIWCNEPSPKSVDYVVVDTIYSEHGGAITPVGTDTLKWGELGIPYTFYSAYPADRVTDVSNIANGEFGMKYITNQLDTVVSLSNGAYLTNPDMNNAYMMAKQEVTPDPSQHHVRLYFDPIMTTFDITVRAGRYEVATGIINPVTVTGVSVIMPNKIDSDKFTYNAKDGTTSDKGSIEASDGSQSVYVGVRNGTSRYVDLHEGETLNLMAFLPPVDMNNGDVKMMVHTTAMDYVLTVPGDQITKQNKYFIQLPDMSPYDSGYNDWISELDNNTPLMTMSIPGCECDNETTPEDIERLLNKGVRAFDMDKLTFIADWHQNISDNFHNVFKDFLSNHPNEFIIVWTKEDLTTDFNENKTPWIDDLADIVESARGKVIALKKGDNYFFQMDESMITSHRIFPHKACDEEDNRFLLSKSDWEEYDWYGVMHNEWSWGVQFITDNNVSFFSEIYNKIVSTNLQEGHTGIVVKAIELNAPYNEQILDDLLIQSIIDCNFKFRHEQ